jgi:hypothetical protein
VDAVFPWHEGCAVVANRPRLCGATCHNARGAKCRCWCGGLFHGPGGEENRAAFRSAFGVDTVPTTERGFLEATGQPDLFSGGLGAGDECRPRRADAVRGPDHGNA